MNKMFWTIFAGDIRLAMQTGGRSWMAIGFFLVVVALFPFGVGPEPALLTRISIGVVWVAALLSALLSLDSIFGSEHEDGNLDLYSLSPLPLEGVVMAKGLAHWVVTGLPIIIAAPFMALMMNMPEEILPRFVLAVVLGTPTLIFGTAVGDALLHGGDPTGGLLLVAAISLFAVALAPFAAAAAIRLARG